MNAWEVIQPLLLILFCLALSIGTAVIILVFGRAPAPPPRPSNSFPNGFCAGLLRRPGSWLAIKSRSLKAVQSALGMHNVKRCSWLDGLLGDEKLFVAPPINGWIIVIGSGLPDPSDDVDACFRFLVGISRKLGQVQFFSASRVLQHHAWVMADRGRVVRAYAWAGHTLWKQGKRTSAEKDLSLRCFDYTETAEPTAAGAAEAPALNVDKVPLLAARWSLDPARIDSGLIESTQGIAGEPMRKY